MSAVLAEKLYSPEEYLALERTAEYKSEYAAGYIYAMTGVSRAHSLINSNISRSLGNQLVDRPCEVHIADMRVKPAQARSYRYPDIAVVCGPAQFEDGQGDTLLNPTVIVEILSPSTESNDRGRKFAEYQRIESLREYLLVAQEEPRIERYARRDEGWLLTVAEGLEAQVALDAIGCVLDLGEVYRRVLEEPPAA
ncbi:Endonuclease, Uma2 family (restriction endonuclease fold) [Methylomagnum ishizawai]|uniref:Endonuclease, Uma2 family (Restriction endonuclease fold) n=1 Tax=Methylomagnum ishizawai TaxID=1760988 RepID=A0A1Y6D719_9GAMM|nr:Uma2 family endonuclease [Methylomagnum ishizawai]SMF96312.1 Endonuclease, Uma2 family (restriction endonuclease fold) [Methylomagnum ishizawai]